MPYFEAIKGNLLKSRLYGFHVDSSESDPSAAVSYKVAYNGILVDNYDYTPAYMDYTNDIFVSGSWNLIDDFFIPRPCMLKYDGTVDYYLDPLDYGKKENGAASDVSDSSYGGNAMVEWGRDGRKIWYKIVPDLDQTSYTVYFSDRKLDADFVSWPFYDADNNPISHFYTRIYPTCLDNNVERSLSGKNPSTYVEFATALTRVKANNQHNKVEWNFVTYDEWFLIALLHVLIGKSLNTQAVFGEGSTYYNVPSGLKNQKGLFWGNNATDRKNDNVVKTFGMESLWGCKWEFLQGFQSVNGVFKYKLTYGTADGSTQNGYVEDGSAPTGYLTGTSFNANASYSFIKKFEANSKGVIVPKEWGGSQTTYYCDVIHANKDGNFYACIWGYPDGRPNNGAFTILPVFPTNGKDLYDGASLSCKPLASV